MIRTLLVIPSHFPQIVPFDGPGSAIWGGLHGKLSHKGQALQSLPSQAQCPGALAGSLQQKQTQLMELKLEFVLNERKLNKDVTTYEFVSFIPLVAYGGLPLIRSYHALASLRGAGCALCERRRG